MSEEVRTEIRCPFCKLMQYMTASFDCRKCGKPLLSGIIEARTVIYLPPEEPPIIPMREVMQAAALTAVRRFGRTTHAAKALDIPHARLKQLLREVSPEEGRDRRRDARLGKIRQP